jgi:hypothetical protein
MRAEQTEAGGQSRRRQSRRRQPQPLACLAHSPALVALISRREGDKEGGSVLLSSPWTVDLPCPVHLADAPR